MDKKDLNKKLDALLDLYMEGVIFEEELEQKSNILKESFNKKESKKEDVSLDSNESIENQKITSKNKSTRKSDDKPIVEISNLIKHYKGRPQPAVNDISFNIFPGEFHVFIGANGAGKTTTIKSIIGAYTKSKYKGNIKIGGFSNQSVDGKALIGYIPEKADFPKKMNTIDYLVSMAMLSGIPGTKAKTKAKEILAKLNMSEFAKKRPSSFSSEQKKKILLAQSLLNDPEVLIMDEPAANLDPIARDELFNNLLELQQQGKSIFLSSHILDEVGKYATYTTILDGGKIVFDGTIDNKINLTELYKTYVKFGSVDNNTTNKL